jgi:hypothetical protein
MLATLSISALNHLLVLATLSISALAELKELKRKNVERYLKISSDGIVKMDRNQSNLD